MSTITKERVAGIASGEKCYTHDDVVELARIALASLEADKEYKHHSIIAEQLAHVLSSMDATDHQRAVISCAVDRLNNVSQLLQSSPSALLVPETLDYQGAKELYNYLMNEEETNATVNGWNACRAAMLQGAKPSKMSGIIPDYEGGVMTQRECFQAGWEGHHVAMLQAGAPVQFGWSKGHFGYHTLFNAIGKAVKIQGGAISISVSAFEDAMLAAAPQQEAK
ncbi:hypothetical protein [Enterobacter asburiae]|uniref:hypothetical protein n=1 Tax=Enterobacter asburiae TaxID=61645 RepID=UPI002075973D|nr:hypothetical protein [Enterobacter asburiae]MCM7837835.1 hypothetical protein [Enterobacter asburiae]